MRRLWLGVLVLSLAIPARTAFACADMGGAVLDRCCCEEPQFCQAEQQRCATGASDQACCSFVTVQNDEQALKAAAGKPGDLFKSKFPSPDTGPPPVRVAFVYSRASSALAAEPVPVRVWQSGRSLYLTTARLRI